MFRFINAMDATEAFKTQIRFLELLKQLTDASRIEWLQADYSPGFVYCLVDGEDLIEFELAHAENSNQAPRQPLAGIVLHHCNTDISLVIWASTLNFKMQNLMTLLKSYQLFVKECATISRFSCSLTPLFHWLNKQSGSSYHS